MDIWQLGFRTKIQKVIALDSGPRQIFYTNESIYSVPHKFWVKYHIDSFILVRSLTNKSNEK